VAALAPSRFIDSDTLTIAGLIRRYTSETLSKLPEQWAEVQSKLASAVGRVDGDAYGVWYDVLKGGGSFSYVAGVRFGEFAPVHAEFTRVVLARLHYAVFVHTAHVTELRRTVDAILTQWLPTSGRELSTVPGQPDFLERYTEEFNRTGAGPIEIWLPIKKR
jgi:predicted transcriptional regulator YdeE